jgi:hypothetical protein
MLLGKAAAAASFVLLQQKRNQQQQSTATTVVVCGGGDFVVNTDGIASTCSFCFMVGTDASSRFCLVVLVELTVKNARFPFFFYRSTNTINPSRSSTIHLYPTT